MKFINIVRLSIVGFSLAILFAQANASCIHDHDCECEQSTVVGVSGYGRTGKWKNNTIPKEDWKCLEVEDLGSPSETCEMCERETIRYSHTMFNANYAEKLLVGCICAGYMEGNLDAAELRNRNLRNQATRRKNFLGRKWKSSKRGNPYIKVGDKYVTITKSRSKFNNNMRYSYSISRDFGNEWFNTADKAKIAAFNKLFPKKIKVTK